MRHAFAAALVLAVICACGGYASGGGGGFNVPDSGLGGSTGTDSGTVGDGGADAGDAGADAGADAGCAATAIPNPQVIDGCDNSSVASSAVILFNQNCTVSISFPNTAAPCTGRISGPNDAFDGGCEGLGLTGCTATSLPGTIVCPDLAGTCNIRVCSLDAGGCN